MTSHLSTDFFNRLSSFCVILLTNKHTNLKENITSLAEVTWPNDACKSASKVIQIGRRRRRNLLCIGKNKLVRPISSKHNNADGLAFWPTRCRTYTAAIMLQNYFISPAGRVLDLVTTSSYMTVIRYITREIQCQSDVYTRYSSCYGTLYVSMESYVIRA